MISKSLVFISTCLLLGSFAINYEDYDWDQNIDTLACDRINRDIDIEEILNKCHNVTFIAGNGSVRLAATQERLLHDFFMSVQDVNVSLLIDRDMIARRLFLGAVKTIASTNPEQLSLLIENTELELIEAPNLKYISGMKVRGNRYLSKQSLKTLELAVDIDSPHLLQSYGECNFYDTEEPVLEGCETVNDLVLLDNENIPANFTPGRIGGCVYLNGVKVQHDFLANVDLKNKYNFDCNGNKTGIINIPSVCLKEYEYYLDVRNIEHTRNGNEKCSFECYEGIEDIPNDISVMKQKWCGSIKGNLLINDQLAGEVDIREVVKNLKVITGRLIIEDLTFDGASEKDIIEELVFPQLLEVTGGLDEPENLIFVNNTNLKKLSFPKLTNIHKTEKAVIITEFNKNLKVSQKDVIRLEVAANGIPISISKSLIVEDTEEKSSANVGLIVGIVIAAVVVISAIVVLAAFLVYRRRKKTGKDSDSLRTAVEIYEMPNEFAPGKTGLDQYKSQDRSSQRGYTKLSKVNAVTANEKTKTNGAQTNGENQVVLMSPSQKDDVETTNKPTINAPQAEEFQGGNQYEEVQLSKAATAPVTGTQKEEPVEGYEELEKAVPSKLGSTAK